jgi:5-formyltetrahydrofolate cyclo-ligase
LAKIEENKIALEKKLLRTNLKNELQKFSQLELQEKSEKICKNILNCKFLSKQKIFSFLCH